MNETEPGAARQLVRRNQVESVPVVIHALALYSGATVAEAIEAFYETFDSASTPTVFDTESAGLVKALPVEKASNVLMEIWNQHWWRHRNEFTDALPHCRWALHLHDAQALFQKASKLLDAPATEDWQRAFASCRQTTLERFTIAKAENIVRIERLKLLEERQKQAVRMEREWKGALAEGYKKLPPVTPSGAAGTNPAGPWPWGSYETSLLQHLRAAAEKFWVGYDPKDPSKAPKAGEVIAFLEARDVSKYAATVMAQILKHDDVPDGPRGSRRTKE